MEERRTWVSILMLILAVGMLVGNEAKGVGITGKFKTKVDECYDKCFVRCFGKSLGMFSIQNVCSRCYKACEFKETGKFCILSWCWKIKWWENGKGDNWWYHQRQPIQTRNTNEVYVVLESRKLMLLLV